MIVPEPIAPPEHFVRGDGPTILAFPVQQQG